VTEPLLTAVQVAELLAVPKTLVWVNAERTIHLKARGGMKLPEANGEGARE
jgi:hypothetical protein